MSFSHVEEKSACAFTSLVLLGLQSLTTLRQASAKAKMLCCLCFSPTGDTVTGDSNGTLYAWGPAVPSHTITSTIREAHKVRGREARCLP
jgi:hypothetical protein